MPQNGFSANNEHQADAVRSMITCINDPVQGIGMSGHKNVHQTYSGTCSLEEHLETRDTH